MLAQSRSEIVTVTGRVLTFTFALAGSQNVINMDTAINAMVNTQMIVMQSNIFTQV